MFRYRYNKKAYYRLSMKYHPDNYVNESEEIQKKNSDKQKNLNQIYQFLINENNKRIYDAKIRKTSNSVEEDKYDSAELKSKLKSQISEIERKIYVRENELTEELERKIITIRTLKKPLNVHQYNNSLVYLSFYNDEIKKLHSNKLYKIFPHLFKKKEEDLLNQQKAIQNEIDEYNEKLNMLKEEEKK